MTVKQDINEQSYKLKRKTETKPSKLIYLFEIRKTQSYFKISDNFFSPRIIENLSLGKQDFLQLPSEKLKLIVNGYCLCSVENQTETSKAGEWYFVSFFRFFSFKSRCTQVGFSCHATWLNAHQCLFSLVNITLRFREFIP